MKHLWIKLYAIERLTLVLILLTAILFAILGVGPRYQPLFYLAQTLGALDNYIIILFLTAVIVTLRTLWQRASLPRAAQKFREAYWAPTPLIHDARHLVAILLILAATAHLKHLTPLLRADIYDAQLIATEKMLLGGQLAGTWLHELFGSASAPLWSWGYLGYYMYMNTIFLVFLVQRNRRLGQEFCMAFGLTWIIGTLAIWLYPTWGPCFFDSSLYADLPQTDVSNLQKLLWFQREALMQNPLHPTALFLISGFPSLHLAVVLLGSWYLRRLHPLLATVSWIFAAVTMVTTLFFGWHYLADNLGAIVLVVVSTTLAQRIGTKES